MIDSGDFLVADWFPGRGMAAEHWHIDNIFIDLRQRDFRGQNREIVPSQRASLDAGMDVRLKIVISILTVFRS